MHPHELGDMLCQLEQAQTAEGGPEAEQSSGHLSQETLQLPPSRCSVWLTHENTWRTWGTLIDLSHSICLSGSLVPLPLPSVPVWLLIKYFLSPSPLFISLPQFVFSKLKVIPKISTERNRGKGGVFFLFNFFFCFFRLGISSVWEPEAADAT